MLQLIPGSADATSTETFALDQKKGAWQPTYAHLRTKSFPTPFAQAEMMSFVLGQLSLDPGARQAAPETSSLAGIPAGSSRLRRSRSKIHSALLRTSSSSRGTAAASGAVTRTPARGSTAIETVRRRRLRKIA